MAKALASVILLGFSPACLPIAAAVDLLEPKWQ